VAGLVVAACGGRVQGAQAGGPPRTASPTPAFASLPAFDDWRLAYLASDGAVHVVSLDGKQDLALPLLPGLDERDRAMALSRDGHLAYINAPKWGNVVIADLRPPRSGGATLTTVSLQATDLAWSPDSARLAVDGTLDGAYGLYLIDPRSGRPTLVPGTGGPAGPLHYSSSSAFLGWTDASHVLVSGVAAGTAGLDRPASAAMARSAALGAAAAPSAARSSGGLQTALLDVTTGAAVAVPLPDGMGIIEIAPDGTQLLLASSCGACCTVLPDLAVLTLATGSLRHLPHITTATSERGGVWKPGAALLAGTIGAGQADQSQLALLDLGADSVTPIARGVSAIAWPPDGQALVVTTDTSGDGPLAVMSPVASGVTPLPLTSGGQFLGFVRTAARPASSTGGESWPQAVALSPTLAIGAYGARALTRRAERPPADTMLCG
jgi:hypothetical protein